MRIRTLASLCVILSTSSVWSARHIGFEMDAFNRVIPATYSRNVVFSPASFELDCAVIAESLETIPKADVSTTLGVVLDLPSTYEPLMASLLSPTNELGFLSARAFCVPDLANAKPAFRLHLRQVYATEVLPLTPRKGSEAWFHAMMEGMMEDFTIADERLGLLRYSLYDLLAVESVWQEPFPTANTRKIAFQSPDGPVELACMADVRRAATWETTDFTMLQLPLRGSAMFFAFLPKSGVELVKVRETLTSSKIDRILCITKSITDLGVAHGPCVIVLPRLSLRSRLDFGGALSYFRVPAKGLVQVAGELAAQDLFQSTYFRLNEHGSTEEPLVQKEASAVLSVTPETKKLIFNRPFVFFVYHEPTASIPVAGLFTGKE